FERKILVGERREGYRTNPAQHFPSTGVATQVGTEDHRISERADKSLSPWTIAIGDQSGHSQVDLTRVVMQQRLEGGDQNHEQRATLAMAEAFGGLREALRQRETSSHCAEIADGAF